MKKAIIVLCIAVMILPLAAAASQVDLGKLSLAVPASCDVFTPGMRPDDPLLALYGTSAEQVARDLGSQGLLMMAREIAGAYTITLSFLPDAGPDYSGMAESELMNEAQLNAQSGALDSVLYSRQAAFLVLRSGNALSLITRVNGAFYRLVLKAQGSLAGQMTDILEKIAQSMDFGRGQ